MIKSAISNIKNTYNFQTVDQNWWATYFQKNLTFTHFQFQNENLFSISKSKPVFNFKIKL